MLGGCDGGWAGLARRFATTRVLCWRGQVTGCGRSYLAVEKRMNGEESEKACTRVAVQASSVAAVEGFMVVVMPSGCVGCGRRAVWCR